MIYTQLWTADFITDLASTFGTWSFHNLFRTLDEIVNKSIRNSRFRVDQSDTQMNAAANTKYNTYLIGEMTLIMNKKPSEQRFNVPLDTL